MSGRLLTGEEGPGSLGVPAGVVSSAQRRTVRTLVASQAIGAMGITIGIATASLLAKDISGSEEQAGLAQTFQVLGSALAAFLLARLMGLRGRRFGLVTGLLLGSAGAALCVVAGAVESMPLLLFGAMLLGSTTAANNAARYAATDLAEPSRRARSLSMVVWATTIGAVLGPNLTGLSARVAERLDVPELTGPFVIGSAAMLVASLVLWLRLRPDPLLLARQAAGLAARPASGTSWSRAVEVVRREPAVLAAVAGLALAHAVMISVMVMTPLHMEHGGAELRVIGMVISVHVLGMFAFAPVVGLAADRWGRPVLMMVGAVLLLVSLALGGTSPAGSSWQIFAGLFLLGLGWSATTVAASTLVSELTPIDARTDVQGAADLVMGLTAAAGGGIAGVVVGAFGYPVLNAGSAALAVGVAVAAVVAARRAAANPPGSAPATGDATVGT